jgi:mRNA-degrading endonuclease RelE of RelBE toxin-antitoxin system
VITLYRIRILDAAIRELARLDKAVGRRIVERIHWLAANLDEIKPEALTGDLAGLYKRRAGDYRVRSGSASWALGSGTFWTKSFDLDDSFRSRILLTGQDAIPGDFRGNFGFVPDRVIFGAITLNF